MSELSKQIREAHGKATAGKFRIGTKVGRTIYDGTPGRLIGVMDSADDAALLCLLQNHALTLASALEKQEEAEGLLRRAKIAMQSAWYELEPGGSTVGTQFIPQDDMQKRIDEIDEYFAKEKR